MSEQAVTYITSTESAIELRGKSYPVYTDFSDNDFIAFFKYKIIKSGQLQSGSGAMGLDPSLADEVARLLKVLIVPDLPDEMINLSRPSGYKILLSFDEITVIFLKCFKIMQIKNPDQWGRLKDLEEEDVAKDELGDIEKDKKIAELEARLAAIPISE